MLFGGVRTALLVRLSARQVGLGLTLATLLTAGPAHAQPEPQGAAGPAAEAPQPPAEHGWLDGEHLTGNWGGAGPAMGS